MVSVAGKGRKTMHRPIDEIKADLEKARKCEATQETDGCWGSDDCYMCDLRTIKTAERFELELLQAITRDIPQSRLEEICNFERIRFVTGASGEEILDEYYRGLEEAEVALKRLKDVKINPRA